MRLGSKAGCVCSPSQHQWEISLDFLSISLENTFVDLHVARGFRCALTFSAVLSLASSIPLISFCRQAITHSRVSSSRGALCYWKLLWCQRDLRGKKKIPTALETTCVSWWCQDWGFSPCSPERSCPHLLLVFMYVLFHGSIPGKIQLENCCLYIPEWRELIPRVSVINADPWACPFSPEQLLSAPANPDLQEVWFQLL